MVERSVGRRPWLLSESRIRRGGLRRLSSLFVSVGPEDTPSDDGGDESEQNGENDSDKQGSILGDGRGVGWFQFHDGREGCRRGSPATDSRDLVQLIARKS